MWRKIKLDNSCDILPYSIELELVYLKVLEKNYGYTISI